MENMPAACSNALPGSAFCANDAAIVSVPVCAERSVPRYTVPPFEKFIVNASRKLLAHTRTVEYFPTVMVDERDTVDTSLFIFPEYHINAGFHC